MDVILKVPSQCTTKKIQHLLRIACSNTGNDEIENSSTPNAGTPNPER